MPIKLSFPVAYQFLENAFNECKLLLRDKTKRNNALVENTETNAARGSFRSTSPGRIGQQPLLSALDVDFKAGKTKRLHKHEESVAHKVDSIIEAFNRLSYNQNVVLVHCAMGVSRSASCVIMYIMKKFKLTLDEVILFISDPF